MKNKIARDFARRRFNKNALKQGGYWLIGKIANATGLELIGDIAEIKRRECSGVCKELEALVYGKAEAEG